MRLVCSVVRAIVPSKEFALNTDVHDSGEGQEEERFRSEAECYTFITSL